MPPSLAALNPNEFIKRDEKPQQQDNLPPDHLLLTPGPLITCIVGTIFGLFLVFLITRWIALQITSRIPRRRRVPGRLPLHKRMVQIIRSILPAFIASRIPDPTPPPVDLDFPARSIDTLPPYPGFFPPTVGSPSDSRRFLFLIPIMPIVHAVTRRPGTPSLNPHGSVTAVGSAITIVAQPEEPPPPDYITLTPPYTANQEGSPTTGPADTQVSPAAQAGPHTLAGSHE